VRELVGLVRKPVVEHDGAEKANLAVGRVYSKMLVTWPVETRLDFSLVCMHRI